MGGASYFNYLLSSHRHTFCLLSGLMPICFCGKRADEYIRDAEAAELGYVFPFMFSIGVRLTDDKVVFESFEVKQS
jgi:hypothetical protein